MNVYRIAIVLTIVGISESLGIRKYDYPLNENDLCGLEPATYSGKCKKVKKCVNLFVEQKEVEICSFQGTRGEETLVCCSREDFYKSRRLNNEGPLDYDNCLDTFRHLRKVEPIDSQQYVVNGLEVESHEFPHIAAIGWLRFYDFSVDWNCGGSLITTSVVVSAAHCTMFNGLPPNVVRLGDVNLKSDLDDTNVQQFGIASILKHPEYRFSSNDHDIALISLSGIVIPTQYVTPVCILPGTLPTEYFEAAGYGQDGEGLQTFKLLKVALKHVEMNKCQESYEDPLMSGSQICAMGYQEDLGMDTCYGDSGSGMGFMNKNYAISDQKFLTPTLVGLTSFGIGCNLGHPSVYVNVSNYIPWIESVIQP